MARRSDGISDDRDGICDTKETRPNAARGCSRWEESIGHVGSRSALVVAHPDPTDRPVATFCGLPSQRALQMPPRRKCSL